jgi:hypothetical protein
VDLAAELSICSRESFIEGQNGLAGGTVPSASAI